MSVILGDKPSALERNADRSVYASVIDNDNRSDLEENSLSKAYDWEEESFYRD